MEANSWVRVIWVVEGGTYSIVGSGLNEYHHQPEGSFLVFTVAASVYHV